MPIRKYGSEPAQVETRVEDNDPETLRSVSGQTQKDAGSGQRSESDNNGESRTRTGQG